jgi:uncharacterized membrane protein YjdF
MNKFEDWLIEVFPVILVFGAGLLAFSVPFIAVTRVLTVQKALSLECGTKYSFIQVAVAGESLSRICQSKKVAQ